MSNKTNKIIQFLGSRRFFTIILIFFILEALWLVFSAIYPMAFDEAYHLGIIQIYSHQFSPFFKTQPHGADQYSALARDPSYLYHYLMSFPYRLVAHYTKFQPTQVIWLRLINVALFSWALIIFRRALLKAKLSAVTVNISILIVALIPIVPLLAAEINYDNLLILLVAYLCLFIVDVIKSGVNREVAIKPLIGVAIICLFASLDQYSFLPIFAATVVFLIVMYWHFFKHKVGQFWHSLTKSFGQSSWATKTPLLVLLVLGIVLVFLSYGINTIKYKSPIPNCDKILTIQQCSNYGPWVRNNIDHQTKGTFKPELDHFTVSWFVGMWYRSFFSINGNVPYENYQNFSPLPIVSIGAIIIVVTGIVLVIVYWRKVYKSNWLAGYFSAITLAYILILFYKNYKGYVYTGQPVAINGRYLIPLLIPMAYVFGLGFKQLYYKFRNVRFAVPLTVIIVALVFIEGGGVCAFMVNSNSGWYWPNKTAQRANIDANHITSKFIVGRNFFPFLH
jgi:hypothetical protein